MIGKFSQNSRFAQAAYVEIFGILILVGVIAWACITGHVTTGVSALVVLPFWTAAGYVGLTIAAIKRSRPAKQPARPQLTTLSHANAPA